MVCFIFCVEVLRPSQPDGMSSAVSLPNHTFLLDRLSPLSGYLSVSTLRPAQNSHISVFDMTLLYQNLHIKVI